MNVAIAYIYPQVRIATYFPLARRFAETWKRFPPGAAPHTLHVISNGGETPPLYRAPFAPISGVEWHTYSNLGWDIGAFQWAAETIPCDLLVCLGSPVHFHRAGWLERMVDAYVQNGPHLYGCWAYLSPNWHVRTTVFWCHPELLNSYPYSVGSAQKSRYEFEHGANSFTRHVMNSGLECLMVTTAGCFPFSGWANHAPGVNESLVLDQHVHR